MHPKAPHFFQCETGAVTVDWVVLSAALVGLGLATLSTVSTGLQDATTDIDTQLKGVRMATAFNSPGGYDTSFETIDSFSQFGYLPPEAQVRLSDELGTISGNTAAVFTARDAADVSPGQWPSGFFLAADDTPIIPGDTYRITYWARTDGDPAQLAVHHYSATDGYSGLTANQTLTGTWQKFEIEATLDAQRPGLHFGGATNNVTYAVDDVKIERISDWQQGS